MDENAFLKPEKMLKRMEKKCGARMQPGMEMYGGQNHEALKRV